jgi:glycosyltransferase involved in cell wall biosynthesis
LSQNGFVDLTLEIISVDCLLEFEVVDPRIERADRPVVAPRGIRRIALVGNHVPRRCGIATFTADTAAALAARYPDVAIDVWAMNDRPDTYDYPEAVTGTIEQNDPVSYSLAAQAIEGSGADLIWIQHEFGIFGGPAGDLLLKLVNQVSLPIAITLHTVLSEPNVDQKRVIDALIARADCLIVMAEKARDILIEDYGARPAQITVIPHGIPDRPFVAPPAAKAKIGLEQRPTILTFGLLSANKGIETMISAMPEIVRSIPEALYLVLGATHPNLVAHEGEAYREQLQLQVRDLGMDEHVRFIDSYVALDELLDYLAAADVYVTPYRNAAQMTSGTLAYAVGLGKAIVSTPYVHASEILQGGHGLLVDFDDTAGFATAIQGLLADSSRLSALQERTYALGRTMIWSRLAEAALQTFEAIAKPTTPTTKPSFMIGSSLSYAAVERMTDATGILQHSVFGVNDRAHGYCIDDNARALIFACRAPGLNREERSRLLAIYCAFVQHAWNAELGVFRNFMGFDQQWLEAEGSHDSVGRTLWALGICASEARDAGTRRWALSLFEQAVSRNEHVESPRAVAFKMLGAVAILTSHPHHAASLAAIRQGGRHLGRLLATVRRSDWTWFEIMLAYDNCRLPEALIRAGLAVRNSEMTQTGLETLEWIIEKQTTRGGKFRPVGHESFGRGYAEPLPFDQQPVEAWATIDACAAAFDLTTNPIWRKRALSAWRWLLGDNDRGVALGDPVTGECCDGLTPFGVNENCGAESILSFQLGAITMKRLDARFGAGVTLHLTAA